MEKVNNLQIKLIYKNNSIEYVNPENLLGSFIYYENMYVFNSINPQMYIIASKKDLLKK